MNITYIPQRIELVFWSAVIPLMKESSHMVTLVKAMYTLFHITHRIPPFVRLVLCAFGGLSLGVGFALLRIATLP